MNRIFVAVLAATVVACGGGGKKKSSPPAPTGAIELTNGSTHYLDELYVAPSTDTSWGGNQLASSIAPGGIVTVGGLGGGDWDLQAVSYGTASVYFAEDYGETVVPNETLLLTVQNVHFSGSMKVTNGGSGTLLGLYVVPAGTSGTYGWGTSQMGAGTLAAGATYHLYNVPPGYYDIKCSWSGSSATATGFQVVSYGVMSTTCY
jgi:hypothetical protein